MVPTLLSTLGENDISVYTNVGTKTYRRTISTTTTQTTDALTR